MLGSFAHPVHRRTAGELWREIRDLRKMRFLPPRKTGRRLSLYSSVGFAPKIGGNSSGAEGNIGRERLKAFKADFAAPGKDYEKMKSIMIIDDDPGIRVCIGEAVNRCGYRPVAHADGASALALLASGERIDAAIVDLKMPGMDGFEFLARARRIAPGLPCIVLSNDGSIEDYLKVMQLGAVEYLNKPFRIGELGKILMTAINKSAEASATGEELFQRRGDGQWAENAPWSAP